MTLDISHDSLAPFSAMLRGALGRALDPEAQSFVAMMADDGVMEFPYAPPGVAPRLVGRAAVAEHVAHLADILSIERIGEPKVHRTTDESVVILEFEGSGRALATGRAYEQRYVSVITLRAGHIQHYLDYWNPLAVSAALDPVSVQP